MNLLASMFDNRSYLYLSIAAGGIAFFLSFLATVLAKRVAVRFNLMDVPDKHKTHAQPVPLLGGCAIFASILGPSLLVLALACYWSKMGVPGWLPDAIKPHIQGAAMRSPSALGILGGAFLLHILGIIDDRRPLGPWIKLIVQIGVAIPARM